MFTGLVNHIGHITKIITLENSARFEIAHQFDLLDLGESICVDGICLTVTESKHNYFECELSSETLNITAAKNYKINQKVNLERAMSMQDRFGGHVVTGHVDEKIIVSDVKIENDFLAVVFSDVSENKKNLLISKGCVCINGVSITINTVDEHGFSVMLIPHTLSKTNLSDLKPGDSVNIEYDYFAKLLKLNMNQPAPAYHKSNYDSTLVQKAIADLQAGKMIILQDDQSRENEGDLIMAAEKITPEAINFMTHYGRGLICMPMMESDFKRLGIAMMVQNNQSKFQTGFGVSIGAAEGITTGISAYDRAKTIEIAANINSTEKDIVKPGHIFPLKARDGGVFVRRGQTEGSVDLVRLAGFRPVSAICEIMNDDGTMARDADLKIFSKKHNLTKISIQDVLEYRMQTENSIEKIASAEFPNKYSRDMKIHIYKNKLDQTEWVAITSGDLSKIANPIVRLHSQCLTGDAFHSNRCDCGEQLESALQKIADCGGVLLYLPQEGRGIGLCNKIKAYALQDQGFDTVQANHYLGFSADDRNYFIPAQILKDLKATEIHLITNNPEKIAALEQYGIIVQKRISAEINASSDNQYYLQTKKEKMGHLIEV